MAKIYLDVSTKRRVNLFLSEENFESLWRFDPRVEYTVPGQAASMFRSPKQHQTEVGKNSGLIADVCWHGASEAEPVRTIRYGVVILDADKHHLGREQSTEEHGLPELYQKYRRPHQKLGPTEHEKLVTTTYTSRILGGMAGKVVNFTEEVLGHSIQTPEPPEAPVILEVYNALRGEFRGICRKHHLFDPIQGGYGRGSKTRPVQKNWKSTSGSDANRFDVRRHYRRGDHGGSDGKGRPQGAQVH